MTLGLIGLRPAAYATIGSLSNDDGDGNENGKKAIGLISKTTTLHVHHAFLYISLPSLHDYNVKVLKIHVLSRTGTQDDNFLFLFLNFDTVF